MSRYCVPHQAMGGNAIRAAVLAPGLGGPDAMPFDKIARKRQATTPAATSQAVRAKPMPVRSPAIIVRWFSAARSDANRREY
jgi:hypothetical protein